MNAKEFAQRPAYPQDSRYVDPRYYSEYGLGGMTLRQRYAMAAMQGILANSKYYDRSIEMITELAFKQADAMLAFEAEEMQLKKDGTPFL